MILQKHHDSCESLHASFGTLPRAFDFAFPPRAKAYEREARYDVIHTTNKHSQLTHPHEDALPGKLDGTRQVLHIGLARNGSLSRHDAVDDDSMLRVSYARQIKRMDRLFSYLLLWSRISNMRVWYVSQVAEAVFWGCKGGCNAVMARSKAMRRGGGGVAMVEDAARHWLSDREKCNDRVKKNHACRSL